MVTVVERCRVAPPDTAAELSLPLTFFDMLFLDFPHVKRLFFFEFPCSKSYFIDSIVPTLKSSLALALKHFTPFAGSFIYPSGPGMPEIQCRHGDSVSVVFAESDCDFANLIGNHARNASKFYCFLPELPSAINADNCRTIPILAVQVTLFADLGISIGLTNHHVVGDANTTVRFIKSWASICKSGGEDQYLANVSLQPLYDRCLIKDPNGKLAEKYWNEMRQVESDNSDPQIQNNPENNKVRLSFLIEESIILKLKNLVAVATEPGAGHHISTFTVTCGYVWSCLAKASMAIGEEDRVENFVFAADYRDRLDPPLPSNYFGNCVGPVFAKVPRSKLIGSNGFFVAAKVIGEAIVERFYYSKEELLRGVEDWPWQLRAGEKERTLGIAGSPRFDAYDADFGWGKPKKFESISIDSDGSMSLCKSRDSEKDLEIGLSLPKIKMDAFQAIFSDGLAML